MIQLSLQSYLRFTVLRAETVFGNRHQTFQRAAESPAQVIPPASNSDKTILNSLQLWLNYCLVFKITWDFFQNLSSPWFGGFFTATRLLITRMFSEVLLLQEHEHRDKTYINGFHYTMWNFKSFKSPLPPTPQKWNFFLFSTFFKIRNWQEKLISNFTSKWSSSPKFYLWAALGLKIS